MLKDEKNIPPAKEFVVVTGGSGAIPLTEEEIAKVVGGTELPLDIQWREQAIEYFATRPIYCIGCTGCYQWLNGSFSMYAKYFHKENPEDHWFENCKCFFCGLEVDVMRPDYTSPEWRGKFR